MVRKLAEIIEGLDSLPPAAERSFAPPEGNALVCGDCLDWLRGCVQSRPDLIYIDPPYASGADYCLPDGEVAFSDRWKDLEQYLRMLALRLQAMRDCLTPYGSIFVHVDYHAQAEVKLLLDYFFGRSCMRNEIVWCYRQGGRSGRVFARKHDTILWYSRHPERWTFNADAVRVPYHGTGGYQRSGNGVKAKSGIVYKPNAKGKVPEDWWDIPAIPPMSAERMGWPTQKPLALLRRIVDACSNSGDMVADYFCGSGTTLLAAAASGRRWIGCDVNPKAVEAASRRLLDAQVKDFDTISLG